MISFRIAGSVRVTETAVALPGLFAKAYDKDLLFDDLLGSSVTAADGHFEIASEPQEVARLDRFPRFAQPRPISHVVRITSLCDPCLDPFLELSIPRPTIDELQADGLKYGRQEALCHPRKPRK